jgi:hypothetical protein
MPRTPVIVLPVNGNEVIVCSGPPEHRREALAITRAVGNVETEQDEEEHRMHGYTWPTP